MNQCEVEYFVMTPEELAILIEELGHDPFKPLRFYKNIKIKINEQITLKAQCRN